MLPARRKHDLQNAPIEARLQTAGGTRPTILRFRVILTASYDPPQYVRLTARDERHRKTLCLVQASSSVAFTFVVMNDHAGNSNHCEPTAI